eukprot:11226460-Lingulodinium_polyedra.AAC.1
MPASTRAPHIRYATIASSACTRRRQLFDYEAPRCHACVRPTKRPRLSGRGLSVRTPALAQIDTGIRAARPARHDVSPSMDPSME